MARLTASYDTDCTLDDFLPICNHNPGDTAWF
jgi:hypothetical protein